ncbi:MAG: hypothetical protein ACK52U_09705 [Synechococcaceae cyanobacterium]
MPALALPPTSAYPSDPTALERAKLDALYLELRGNYKSLMISRGIHRSRSQRQGEQLQELGTRLRDLATREASVRAEAYAMLQIVTDVVEHLEDSGDELSNAFGQYQLGPRAYNGGGRIARLVQAVIRFLNLWRQGKERFEQLSARQNALRTSLERPVLPSSALGDNGQRSSDRESGKPQPDPTQTGPTQTDPTQTNTPQTGKPERDVQQLSRLPQPSQDLSDGQNR